MYLSYKPAIVKGAAHLLLINGEYISTTKQKEVLLFARNRITDKFTWKELKEAIRLGQPIEITGGK